MGTHDMIDISVTSKHGNTALTFPHTGFFGVTPVVLAGAVHLKLHEQYPEALPIRSVQLQIRCYEVLESGAFRASSKEHVMWETVHDLWRPKAGTQEMPFPRASGVWDHPFKVRLPLAVADHASGVKSFREWRVKWRFEVLVNHKPIPHVGHRVARSWPLELRDHRQRPTTRLLSSSPSGSLLGAGAAAIQVFINPPTSAYGPLDTIPLSVSVRPEDPTTVVRKVTVVLERRLELLDRIRSRRSSPTANNNDEGPPHKSSRISAIFHRGASPRPSRTDEEPSCARAITTTVSETTLEVSAPGDKGLTWCAGSMTLPARTHRWDIGETEQTDLVNVSFALRVKVTVKPRRHNTAKELVAPLVPVSIVSTTAAERAEASKAALPKRVPSSCASSFVSQETAVDELRHKVRPCSPLYLHGPSATDISLARVEAPAMELRPILIKSEASSEITTTTETTTAVSSETASVQFAPEPPGYDSRPSSRETESSGRSVATSPAPAVYGPLPSVRSMLRYNSPTPAPSMGGDSPRSVAVVSPRSCASDPVVYGSRRRISMSTSDDDDLQPLRSRPKLWKSPEAPVFGLPGSPSPAVESRRHRNTTRLPSLDVLGLGLPHVPDAGAPRTRPSTAPHPSSFGVYCASRAPDGRPASSGSASFAFTMPHGRNF